MKTPPEGGVVGLSIFAPSWHIRTADDERMLDHEPIRYREIVHP